MLILNDCKNAFPPTRQGGGIATIHKIFSWAFNEIWINYEKGRGKVYVFDSPFKQCSFLGNLTGLIYWSANVNKIINEGYI